jgi:hypothetical protein
LGVPPPHHHHLLGGAVRLSVPTPPQGHRRKGFSGVSTAIWRRLGFWVLLLGFALRVCGLQIRFIYTSGCASLTSRTAELF